MALDRRESSPLSALSTSPPPVPSSPLFLHRRGASDQPENDQPGDNDQPESPTSWLSSPPSSPTLTASASSSSSSRPTKKQKRGRPHQTDLEKLSTILHHLRDLKWTVKTLSKKIIEYGDHPQVRRAKGQLLNIFYVDLPQEPGFAKLITSRRSSALSIPGAAKLWQTNFVESYKI